MINHARNLLLNINGPSLNPQALGEEFVPPEFTAKILPQALANVQRLLFGTAPTRDLLNYRLREIMTMLHATELGEYVLALDPRITYNLHGLSLLTVTPPVQRLADLLPSIQAGLSDAAAQTLFGEAVEEPYATFYHLWHDHPYLPYRLGGLLLAYIYRLNDLTFAGNQP